MGKQNFTYKQMYALNTLTTRIGNEYGIVMHSKQKLEREKQTKSA